MVGVELAFVFNLFGEGIEVGCVLCAVNVFGELVDPTERASCCVLMLERWFSMLLRRLKI